jgi:hypothetical protein
LQSPVEIKSVQQERRLAAMFDALNDVGREMLLEYAEYLAGRHPRPISAAGPLEIPRPEIETVVAAIKRLVETFPMLERSTLFHETSGLMAQHMLYARPAPEVIDQLEVLFRQHYTVLVERRKTDPSE